jgi:predicted metal-binding membrane protein
MSGVVSARRTGETISPVRLALILVGPVAIAVAAWIYLAIMIGDMAAIPGMSTMMMAPQMFTHVQLFGLFLMWAVMMAAMMLPTALPMVLAFARMQSADRNQGAGWMPVILFSSGYAVAWAGFSLAAALLQAGLTNHALVSPMMMKTTSASLAGGILILAGAYQFTSLKQSCLKQCRSPISFLMTQWRSGNRGALLMGTMHGVFCVGCCWALMGLLFVAGVMNTVWIIIISLYVLVEKTVPSGERLSKLLGAVMLGMGLWFII